MAIPDFITHYNRSLPFRSISQVSKENLGEVLSKLNEANAWGVGRFSDPEYLPRRLVVEQKLRCEFIAKGGSPVLQHPIYFFLGRNAEFETHERNRGYKVHLRSLPQGTVSFTYGDSMYSLNEDYRRLKGGGYLSELCRHVYCLEDLRGLFFHIEEHSSVALHIEAQLWIAPLDAMIHRID